MELLHFYSLGYVGQPLPLGTDGDQLRAFMIGHFHGCVARKAPLLSDAAVEHRIKYLREQERTA